MCVIACSFPDGITVTRTGILEGCIAKEISGLTDRYDLIFMYLSITVLLLKCPPPEQRINQSQGKALKAIKEVLLEYMTQHENQEIEQGF